MTRLFHLPAVFWTVATIDAVLLLVALAMTLPSRAGANDGGREMGLFFFIAVPAAVLGVAALVFRFGPAPLKPVALLVVLLPGLWFAKVQIEDRLVDRRIEANRQGSGHFDTDTMRRLGAAVVQRDVDTLMQWGRSVDIDTRGRNGMTLMQLAVDTPDSRRSDGSELPVVRALLALGASPDPAMRAACLRLDSALLDLLLAAGGHPNLALDPNRPLVFDTMSVITPGNVRRLVAHGLDLDSTSHGDPLPVQLAIHRRWDLLLIAIEHGADTARARPDGRTVAGELAGQIDEERQAGREPPAELLRAQAALADSRSKQQTKH